MGIFTFIHTADLHLGRPFTNIMHLDASTQGQLINASFETFSALVDYAITRQVDFVLISGDVFDGNKPSLKLQNSFISQLTKLSEYRVKVFIICGNHDQEIFENHTEALSQIPNVYIFNDEIYTHSIEVRKNKIKIHGISFEQNVDLIEETRKVNLNDDSFHVFLLHADISRYQRNDVPKKYSEIELQRLLDIPVDYWALGHLHNYDILHTNPHVVYPGTIQGTSFKPSEQGAKGFCMVSVENNRVQACELITSSQLLFQELPIEYKLRTDERLVIAKDIAKLIKEKSDELPLGYYKKIVTRAAITISYDAGISKTDPLSPLDLLHIQEVIIDELKDLKALIELADIDWSFTDTIHSEIAQEIFSIGLGEIDNIINYNDDFISKISKIKQKIPVLDRVSAHDLSPLVEKELRRILIGL